MSGNQYRINHHSTLLLKAAIDSGITSREELAALMGNAHVETGGFSTMHEDFRYRSAKRLVSVVGSADERFSWTQIEDAVRSRDPEQIATIMYENRKNLGNDQSGDGWRFHGRGFFQYTGRHNYTSFGQKFGVDLVNNPDLAAEPVMAAKLAIAYWQHKVPTHNRHDVAAAGRMINGGDNGEAERIVAARGWASTITPQLIADIKSGNVTPEQFASAPDVRARSEASVRDVPKPRELPNAGLGRSRDLELGDHGADVRSIQMKLRALGYHDAEGRPLSVDGDFGKRTEEAVTSFQGARGLALIDGVVGSKTWEALSVSEQAPLLSNPAHPDNAMYQQALRGVQQLPPNSFKNDTERSNAAATLVFEAKVSGVRQIDHVVLSNNGSGLFAVQGKLDDPAHSRIYVDRAQAVAQPVERSTEQLRQETTSQQQAQVQSQVHIQQQQVEYRGVALGIRP